MALFSGNQKNTAQNAVPADKRALAVKMAEIYAAGLADGVELVTMRTERKDADATNPKAV